MLVIVDLIIGDRQKKMREDILTIKTIQIYAEKMMNLSFKENLPPAIVGDLKGLAKSASLCNSDLGIGSHLKFRPQLKPPRTKGLGEY